MDEPAPAETADSRRYGAPANAGASGAAGRPSKRPREEHVRLRVSRACDRCKARKTRCSGTWPCDFCSNLSLECQFNTPNRRSNYNPAELGPAVSGVGGIPPQRDVRSLGQPHTPLGPLDAASDRGSSSHGGDVASSRYTDVDSNLTSPAAANSASVSTSGPRSVTGMASGISPGHDVVRGSGKADAPRPPRSHSLRASPEPSQTDQQGHYVGPASGVSFLLRVQRKLQVQSPGYLSTSIFNFGDRPLNGHDASFVILPPKPLAEAMLKRYFEFAATTHRFLHRPSVEAWLEELYDTNGAVLYQEGARSRTALLFMVFAHSNNYRGRLTADTKDGIEEAAETSARFFAVAEHQLSVEKGEIRLASVQARLAQCFYLLAQSRLNHCWTLFGITAHLVLALGIHRKARIDRNSGRIDHIDLECRKRTFWCAYNLNTYLSAALGRPMTFHDEDIDQELPQGIDDEHLRASPTPPQVMRGPSILSASVAQIKLSRILARILRALYGIHQPSTEEHFALAARFSEDLDDWRNNMAYLLDTDGNSAIFVRLVLRQRDVLRLAFCHAQILVHRPFLLKTFGSLVSSGSTSESLSTRRQELQKNIKICIDAAMQIIEHIDRIDAAGEFYSTLFFIPYYGFSAVVILYLYAIQQRAEPPEQYLRYFRAASKCHSQLESIATKGSLMQRYGVVLQELRLEVLRNNMYLASVSTPQAGGSVGDEHDLSHVDILHSSQANQPGMGQSAVRHTMDVDGGLALRGARGFDPDHPSGGMGGDSMDVTDDGLAYMASWGQFDSLVTGGTGALDLILPEDSTDGWDTMNPGSFQGW